MIIWLCISLAPGPRVTAVDLISDVSPLVAKASGGGGDEDQQRNSFAGVADRVPSFESDSFFQHKSYYRAEHTHLRAPKSHSVSLADHGGEPDWNDLESDGDPQRLEREWSQRVSGRPRLH